MTDALDIEWLAYHLSSGPHGLKAKQEKISPSIWAQVNYELIVLGGGPHNDERSEKMTKLQHQHHQEK